MEIIKKIEMSITYAGKSEAWLAKEIGTTPQNFNNKKKRKSFTHDDLEKIAKALGAEYKSHFDFPDGTSIG